MRPYEIDQQLKQRRFVPVRMHFSDGSYYDIPHPEMALVSRTVISVAIYAGEDTRCRSASFSATRFMSR